MKIILIYFFLFAFLAENTLGYSSIIKVKGLSLPNLGLYLLLLGWAYNILIKRKLFEWNSLNKYLILFIFLVILSIPYKILLDEIPDISIKLEIIWLKNWVEPFIIFFVMFNILDDKSTCKKVFWGLGILLLITALNGPLNSLNIVNLGRTSSSIRTSGFSGDSNEFAAYLVLFIPIVLTFAIFHKNNTIRIFSALTLSSTFFALIFTGSRGGILSFAAGIFGYLLMLYSQDVMRLRTILSVAVVVLLVSTLTFVLAPPKVRKMVSYRLDPAESESVEKYSTGRLRIWRYCISLFAEKPIFGHGFHTLQESMYIRFGFGRVAHNQYLHYLVELGIIGCSVFILIFLKIFHIIWNFLKITPDLWEKKLYIGYIAGLLGYTSSMLFVNLGGAPRQIFWFYTAVFLRYGQLNEIGEKNSDRSLTVMKKDTVL